MARINDPVERIVADALRLRDIPFEHEPPPPGLDFYLPTLDVHIECKRFHTARVLEQMRRHQNVIVIQGIGAAEAFARMLASGRYALFVGYEYYPNRAWEDFVGFFDAWENAAAAAVEPAEDAVSGWWYQVVDISTGEVIASEQRLPSRWEKRPRVEPEGEILTGNEEELAVYTPPVPRGASERERDERQPKGDVMWFNRVTDFRAGAEWTPEQIEAMRNRLGAPSPALFNRVSQNPDTVDGETPPKPSKDGPE